MKINIILFLTLLLELNMMANEAPDAKKIPFKMSEHGNERIDNYYWMNERDSKDVLEYIEKENNYTKNSLSHTEALQSQIFEEITGRIKADEESVPYKDNGYYYYFKFIEGKEYKIHCRKKDNLDSKEEVIYDENIMGEQFEYFALGSYSVSPDNKLLAYSYDNVSRRQYKIQVRNIETGLDLEESIENTSGRIVWANDNKHFFYAKKDPETLREYQVWRHELGTDQSDDVLVFQEDDETFNIGIGKSKSKKYIWIISNQTVSSEAYYIDSDEPLSKPISVVNRQRDHEYSVYHYNEHFYILSNYKATNFKLMKVKVEDSQDISKWEELIGHRDDTLLEDVEIFNSHLVLQERHNGLINIRMINWNTEEDKYLEFKESAYNAWIGINLDFNSDKLRFGYTSLTTPFSTLEYDFNTGESILLKEKEVLGGFDKNNYETKRIYIEARDGEKVPVSIVHKKGIELNSDNPLLLYGYGSYGITIDPVFNYSAISLLDRGFVYAIAHIRGGEEMGRQWYENGKLLKKKNTFTDFIDCGEKLIEMKYTSNEKLFAMGGSAGGLLMGAVVNMRPDLFKGIIAAVPFVDVVTTMLDESIPLTTGEYDEWGNPNNKEYYEYMLSYSPYDNVAELEYPNMLITTGYHDSQVQYWEPLKWTAKLRDLNQSTNSIYLNVQMEAGHGGASGRFRRFKETAMEYAFLIDLLEK